jgi:mannose-6-phosphate isomerase-like protein (cupin superfamily)
MLFKTRNELSPIDFEGLNILDYTAELSESSSFAVISVPPGARHGLSWSKRSDKYYYVIEGRLQFELEGRVRTLASGDFCIVHQGEKFDYRNESGAPAEIVLVHTPSFDLESEVFESD